tara:strand:- start:5008 stop:5214 length:207 start_codon:yes stop_codon:yes gene_type:complete
MELKEYLKENKITQIGFVDLLAQNDLYITQGAINKWVNGDRIPRKKEMAVIYKSTNGEVTPNDFYKLD